MVVTSVAQALMQEEVVVEEAVMSVMTVALASTAVVVEEIAIAATRLFVCWVFLLLNVPATC